MAHLIALNDRIWPVLTLALALTVLVLSLVPRPELDLPQGLENDKVQHFLGYAAIVFPAAFARGRRLLLVVGLVAAMGAAIEIIQPHVGRHGSPWDVLANCIGILIGTVAGLGLRRLLDSVGAPARSR